MKWNINGVTCMQKFADDLELMDAADKPRQVGVDADELHVRGRLQVEAVDADELYVRGRLQVGGR